ncbi:MAG: single-stranded-DNA-specific exonuclease RecJ [Candidatus Sungbacteria bacterium]|nr:single-stranded-DNA-specific exonuclease RecJ [Candidatus Sungbacteria bacterium]
MTTYTSINNWNIKPSPPEEFCRKFPAIAPLTLRLLWNRGINEKKAIETVLNPSYEDGIYDPYLFRHMEIAASRIEKAFTQKEKITIFGDYDADGVCGTAILAGFFKKAGLNFDVYIPDRSREHFGLSLQKVKDFYTDGTRILITVDCGVTDFDEIELANSLGMDTIILDHHLVPPRWPNALAIIDHKHPEEPYPEKVLSGAGLAFKLVQGLIKTERFPVSAGWEKWLLDLVAIAAIADMVPLTGENRTLVTYGLKVLAKTRRLGIKYLFSLKEKNPRDSNAETISHFIAPRINAASRMDHANAAFLLLTTENDEEARWLAARLEDKNEERKHLVEEIMGTLNTKFSASKPASIIFEGSSEWPAGVLGLVASRLVETYQRPAFLYAANEEMIKGSCRAPRGINVVELMRKAGDVFADFGGHTLSGGFAALPENLPRLKQKLEIAAEGLTPIETGPGTAVDAELELEEVGETTFECVKALEPFGQENPRPTFLVKNARIADIRKVGADGSHLKMKLGPRYIGAIYFRSGENDFKTGEHIDIICELQENIWNGTRKIELRVTDARHSQ